MTTQILTIKYDIDQPVPITDFVASLQSLQSIHGDGELELCVKEIRKGSYIFELVNQVPDALIAVMPTMMEQTENLAKFTKNIKTLLDFFKTGKKEDDTKAITKQEAIAAHDLVAPLTINSDSSVTIENNNGVVEIYNFTDAHAIQNSSRKYIDDLERTTKDIRQAVSLQWKNLADQDVAGNKAVIPDIHSRTVVTRFGNDTLHDEMVKKCAHPFNHLWEVNVHVEWHGDRPKRYTIIELIEDLGEVD